MKRLRSTIILSALAAGILACGLPFIAEPTPFVFPTPDLTLTAIYSVLQVTPDTPLPPLPMPSATPLAYTETPAAATNTPVSLPTQTSEPTGTPAATATLTATQIPPTVAPALVRPDGSVAAAYVTNPPTIDGNFSEWNLYAYAVDNIVYGASAWDGKTDLSGYVMVGWDTQYLYLAASVTDEDYEQNATKANLFKGDGLEILLDTNLAGDFYVDKLSPDDFQLGISPGYQGLGKSPEAYLWFPRTLEGSRSDVKIAASEVDHGYQVEAAIPWSVFETIPQAGTHFGFGVSFSDNDKDGEAVQQTMASIAPRRYLANPMTWIDLVLNPRP